jgi:hypothetical protein
VAAIGPGDGRWEESIASGTPAFPATGDGVPARVGAGAGAIGALIGGGDTGAALGRMIVGGIAPGGGGGGGDADSEDAGDGP